ncbi:MAG: hypothetical protein M1831_007023 [Alyxoria varia]|nr:MAG: hypothetical protein M1831_007023 [Alyxoria varia]
MTAVTDTQSVTSNLTPTDLAQLVNKLERTISSSDPEARSEQKRLRRCSIERRKVGVNLNYANSLLRQLERNDTVQPPSTNFHKPDSQNAGRDAFFADQRKTLDCLQQKLDKIGQVDSASDFEDEEDDDEEGSDIVARFAPQFAPAVKDTVDGRELNSKPDLPPDITSQATAAAAAATLSSGLRARQGRPDAETNMRDDYATTTSSNIRQNVAGTPDMKTSADSAPQHNQPSPVGSSGPDKHTASVPSEEEKRAALFSSSQTKHDTTATPSNPTDHTRLLEAHDTEQESLTSSLVQLAGALKSSTQSFSTKLEESNPLLNNTVKGLEGNVEGMQSTSTRMGTLRRMSEGKGWFGRMGLYAIIAALAVVVLLEALFLPRIGR